MKILNWKILKKILIVLVIFNVFSFLIPNVSNAGMVETLVNPVVDLLIWICDSLMTIAHNVILHYETNSVIMVNINDGWQTFWTILAIMASVVVIIAVVAGVVLTAGAGVPFLSAICSWLVAHVGIGSVLAVTLVAGTFTGVSVYNSDFWEDDIPLPLYSISPEEIIRGEIPLFNADFFYDYDKVPERKNYDSDSAYEKALKIYNEKEENTAYQLKGTIAKWYLTIRNICIVLMMGVLVYIGIMIVKSAAGKDKAKYKTMLLDWLVAMCMLFLMHYGMSFINMGISKLTGLINKSTTTVFVQAIGYDDKTKDKLKQAMEDLNFSVEEMDASNFSLPLSGKIITDDNGNQSILWETNLMGKLRMETQYARKQADSFIGYALMYAVLVCLTIYFMWTYLKRILYIAFFTLIAPFVALTYPIDKVKDGQAQAFQFWIKEYIYNLALQPLHLLLYSVLVGSAIELATTNVIYGLVAIGFLVPAEKLFKQMFGFKGNTPGSVPGGAGGALMMEGFRALTGWGPQWNKNKDAGNSSKGKNDVKHGRIKTTETGDPYGEFSSSMPQQALTDGNSEGQTQDSDNESTGDGTGAPTGDGAGTSTGDGTGTTTGDGAGTSTGDGTGDPTGEGTGTPTGDGTGAPTGDGAGTSTGEGAGTSTGDEAGTSTGDGTETPTGDGAGTQTRRSMAPINPVITKGKPIFSRKQRRAARKRKLKARWNKWKGGEKSKALNYLNNYSGDPLRGATRFTGKIFGGALGAGIGLALGIASGDPSKAFQNALIGGKGGAKWTGNMSDGLSNTATSLLGVEGINEVGEAAYWGDQYEEYLMRKKLEETRRNPEFRKAFQLHYRDEAKVKKLLDEDGIVDQYQRAGIDKEEDIIAAIDLQDKFPELGFEGSVHALNIYKQIKGKDYDKQKTILKNKFKDANKNLNDSQIDKLVEQQIKYSKQIDTIRNEVYDE